jgi:hypothetical protein
MPTFRDINGKYCNVWNYDSVWSGKRELKDKRKRRAVKMAFCPRKKHRKGGRDRKFWNTVHQMKKGKRYRMVALLKFIVTQNYDKYKAGDVIYRSIAIPIKTRAAAYRMDHKHEIMTSWSFEINLQQWLNPIGCFGIYAVKPTEERRIIGKGFHAKKGYSSLRLAYIQKRGRTVQRKVGNKKARRNRRRR